MKKNKKENKKEYRLVILEKNAEAPIEHRGRILHYCDKQVDYVGKLLDIDVGDCPALATLIQHAVELNLLKIETDKLKDIISGYQKASKRIQEEL